MLRRNTFFDNVSALIAALVISSTAVNATDKHLEDGVAAYNSGNYSDAVSLFGQALSTEFNNPILHYYYGNALNKMKQKPDAIREYRIALSPHHLVHCLRPIQNLDLEQQISPLPLRLDLRLQLMSSTITNFAM